MAPAHSSREQREQLAEAPAAWLGLRFVAFAENPEQRQRGKTRPVKDLSDTASYIYSFPACGKRNDSFYFHSSGSALLPSSLQIPLIRHSLQSILRPDFCKGAKQVDSPNPDPAFIWMQNLRHASRPRPGNLAFLGSIKSAKLLVTRDFFVIATVYTYVNRPKTPPASPYDSGI